MMNTKKDKVKKKAWEKPAIKMFSIKETSGGEFTAPPEDQSYDKS